MIYEDNASYDSTPCTKYTLWHDFRNDFWEILPRFTRVLDEAKILKSQLATQFTMWNDSRADFWEFQPGAMHQPFPPRHSQPLQTTPLARCAAVAANFPTVAILWQGLQDAE